MADQLDFDIAQRPDFSLLQVRLRRGERIFAEPSAMATMDSSIHMKAGLRGGLWRSVGRALGGENLIMNTFSAPHGDGEVTFAPGPMGDVLHYRLHASPSLLLQRGAFVAHGQGVEVSASWQGMRGFFSGEGLVLLRASGSGDLFFNTYGATIEIDVDAEYFVDTGYVVAFEDTLQYDVTVLPGLGIGKRVRSFFFGGEGLVCRFRGQGKLWVQTRAINPFLTWMYPYRPAKKNRK